MQQGRTQKRNSDSKTVGAVFSAPNAVFGVSAPQVVPLPLPGATLLYCVGSVFGSSRIAGFASNVRGLRARKWCTLSFSFARNWGPRGAVFLWLRGRRPMDLAILRSCDLASEVAPGTVYAPSPAGRY